MIELLLLFQALFFAICLVGGIFATMEALQALFLPEVIHFRSCVYTIIVLIPILLFM
jgi:hypothetical protein